MTMKIGDKIIKGLIKKREEARSIYEQAKSRGNMASLLDQERPNIFTQAVANILPGQMVQITISYSEILPYEDGSFKFSFPMVVGPRFIPGQPHSATGTGWSPDTTLVPDASKITPPVAPQGSRAGHDIDLQLTIKAGLPILKLDSRLHQIDVTKIDDSHVTVKLRNPKEIPNKDFVLEYLVAGEEIKSGYLVHKQGDTGYISVIMLPPKRVVPEQTAPREMIFVIDCSGSQHGLPLEKAKDAMKYFIDKMGPKDTFNIIDFNVGARSLFSEPKDNSPENRAKALKYLAGLEAKGGTWMGPAIEQVCKTPAPENRLRIVSFMTDGYVGNDFEIISLVQRLRGNSRWFPFGTGNSVNRFLLDMMARGGGGEVEYILLNSPGEQIAKNFYSRIAEPVMTNITLETQGIEISEMYPNAVSDLWARKPIIFKAKYSKAGSGNIILKGLVAGKPYTQNLPVNLPETSMENSAVPGLWARSKVDDLMDKDWLGAQKGTQDTALKDQIISTALEHRIMTQYTSFVAVEETQVMVGGKPITIAVPVELPEGVSREHIFGPESVVPHQASRANVYSPREAKAKTTGAMGLITGSAPKRSSLLPQGTESVMKAEMERDDKQDSGALKDAPESKMSKELIEFLKSYKSTGQYVQTEKIKMENGKILLQLRFNDVGNDTAAKLQRLGFETTFVSQNGRVIIGSIKPECLEELASWREIVQIETVKM
jgi:Ca-activated chloride channel family protein